MLSKCANPECSTPFQYYRDGKLYRIEVSETPDSVLGPKGNRVEHFWLCGECAATMTLGVQRGSNIVTVPLKKTAAKVAAKSIAAAAAAAS